MSDAAEGGTQKPLSRAKRRAVAKRRAAGHCEYCRLVERGQLVTFHLEHVVPSSVGGSDELDNLAWACSACNVSKSDRIVAPDPQTGQRVAIFNPREMPWWDHFEWADYRLIGRTPIGRALIDFLNLNSAKRLEIREIEDQLGEFPPPVPSPAVG